MNPSDLIPGELYWLESQAVAYRWIWDMAVVTNGGGFALEKAETKDPVVFIEKTTIKGVGRNIDKAYTYYVFLCVQFDKGQNIFFGGFDEDSVWNIKPAKEPRQPF